MTKPPLKKIFQRHTQVTCVVRLGQLYISYEKRGGWEGKGEMSSLWGTGENGCQGEGFKTWHACPAQITR